MTTFRTSAWYAVWLSVGVGLACWALFTPAAAEDKKPRYPKAPDAKDVKLVPDAWKTAPRTPLAPGEIDRLLEAGRSAADNGPELSTTDEQFVRRACQDVTGKPPTPDVIEAFVNDPDSGKRSKLIDRLLASGDFAQHWGRQLRDVLLWRATDLRIVARLPRTVALELWLTHQLKENRSWAAITRDLLTAKGGLRHRSHEGGENAFLLAHTGEDAPVERAADTSRVFLGIRIQCAQCHDHPEDIWKRNQFHELAAFFGRTGDQSNRTEGGGVIELVARPDGEYQMPGQDDPKKFTTVHPRFLTGEEVPQGLSDAERRRALADLITSKENFWFAAAFVNRVWGVLMGQAFYEPVDDMGPLKEQEATRPEVLLRVADAFRTTDHDIKGLFRVILNSQAYQRQFRLGENAAQHVKFAGNYPSRLSGEALWQALFAALGPFPSDRSDDEREFRGGAGVTGGPFAKANPTLVYLVKLLFDADPSLRPDDVEGSITQALMLMNNKVLNSRIRATGDTPLAQLMNAHANDDSAVQALYLRSLGRKPTADELTACRDYLKQVGKRGEAFEDILWTLVNSTEFQSRR
jgi:hypothetical protein